MVAVGSSKIKSSSLHQEKEHYDHAGPKHSQKIAVFPYLAMQRTFPFLFLSIMYMTSKSLGELPNNKLF